jgi:hypothetical protein
LLESLVLSCNIPDPYQNDTEPYNQYPADHKSQSFQFALQHFRHKLTISQHLSVPLPIWILWHLLTHLGCLCRDTSQSSGSSAGLVPPELLVLGYSSVRFIWGNSRILGSLITILRIQHVLIVFRRVHEEKENKRPSPSLSSNKVC